MKQPAKFTVDTISAGQGDVMVFVEDPEGNKEEVCWRRLPLLLVSHGNFGAYNRARDCVSIFLIKAQNKSFFFSFKKKKKNPESLAVKFTCLRVVFKVSYKLIPKDTHYIIQLNIAFNYCY